MAGQGAGRGEQWAETGVGAVVLAAAGAFLVYALTHVGHGGSGAGYEVTARFGDVGSLASGADVRVAGVKVGTVSKVDLDPKTFLARTHLTIDSTVKLPSDTSARIASDGLLGGAHVALSPGGAADDLKPGAEISNTQGAVDLFGLIGQFVRGGAGAGASAPSNAAASGAPAADPYPAAPK